ncbi:MAG: hypothetical protein ACJ8AW_07195 [Rhodopila sp.]
MRRDEGSIVTSNALGEWAALARIDRDLAESAKLRNESEKFIAEQRKLMAESLKIDRQRRYAPALAVVSVVGGLLGVATFIARFLGH